MDIRILIIGLTLTCYLFEQCQSKKTNIKDFVGEEYRDLSEVDFFKNFRNKGASLFESPDRQDFVLSNYRDGKLTLLVLAKTKKQTDGKVRYIMTDIQEISGLTKNQFISPVACELNGKSDPIIIAVCESPSDKEVESYEVLKAWKINWETRLLEPIGIKGVECINPTYGVDTN